MPVRVRIAGVEEYIDLTEWPTEYDDGYSESFHIEGILYGSNKKVEVWTRQTVIIKEL